MSTLHTQVKRSLLLAVSVAFLLGVTGQGVAHAAANAMVSNQASSSGFPAGGQIYDSAMLGNGVNPTGWLTFKLFGPSDTSCAGAPLLTTTTAVNGNGYYESSRYTTNSAGTYRWTVAYGGDANNNATPSTSCNDPAGDVQVAKRAPNLNTPPRGRSPAAFETASLTSGVGPTGTMTLHRLRPQQHDLCRTADLHLQPQRCGQRHLQVGVLHPEHLRHLPVGRHYSGDSNNNARASVCSDTSNGFTASTAKPAVVSGSPYDGGPGRHDHRHLVRHRHPTNGDWVALYAAGTAGGGAVSAWKYTGGGDSGSVNLKFPWGATAGTYEIRLLANNNIQRLATSAPITLVW